MLNNILKNKKNVWREKEEVDKMTKTVTVDPEVAEKDTNGDGHISKQEMEMDLEFKRKELEDADARRDAMRQMTWFAFIWNVIISVCSCTRKLDWFRPSI